MRARHLVLIVGAGIGAVGAIALVLSIGQPHFYMSGLLIVAYAGGTDSVLQPLKAVLGKPFAHR